MTIFSGHLHMSILAKIGEGGKEIVGGSVQRLGWSWGISKFKIKNSKVKSAGQKLKIRLLLNFEL